MLTWYNIDVRRKGNDSMTKVEMKKIDALTETGKVKPAVREGLRAAFNEKHFEDWQVANDGSFLVPLVEDLSGAPIYARVQVTITAQNEFSTGKKKKAKKDAIDFSALV